ncbi:MAG: VanZ family protein [Bacilli bacterium]|nr:VanZ family protein [Bacilli bacterium]
MKNKRYQVAKWILVGLAIMINAYIIMQSCFDAGQSTSQSGFVFNIVKSVLNFFHKNTINESNASWWHGFLRKLVGHFGLFVIDGIFTSWALYYVLEDINATKKWWKKIIISGAFGLFIAALTEIIQLSIPGRAGDIKDVLIDYAGYLLGLCIIIFVYWCIYRHKLKQKEE